MGYGKVSDFLAQIKSLVNVTATRKTENPYKVPDFPGKPTQSVPVPQDGPFFFPVADVPISQYPNGYSLMLGYMPGQCTGVLDPDILTYKVAFALPNRANYVLWRYNQFVQVCTDDRGSGGNRTLTSVINKLHGMFP
jgi:hypothetical protein